MVDLTFSCRKTTKLVAIHAPPTSGQNEYFRDLEKFMGTSYSLILLVYYNTI